MKTLGKLLISATILTSLSLSANIASADILSRLTERKINYTQFFNSVKAHIKKNYVEEVTDKQLIEGALEGMVTSLDPHSSFLDTETNKELRMHTKGEFGGLGIEMTMYKGLVKVISPYEDGPAFKAGIRSGDLITSADGESIKNLSIKDAVEKLRGKPKSTVELGIFRESTSESFFVKVTRDIISITPIKAKVFDNNIAYFKITTFNQKLSDLLKKEWNTLTKKVTPKGVILDLRWNPGGLLDQAIAVSDFFLDKDLEIVSIKGRSVKSTIYKTKTKDVTNNLPIVVLINEGSASASEIVAGSIQDHKRGLVLGQKSFGKGSVQTIVSLPANTAIKLTTARYYTPSGRSIQAEGIQPDITVAQSKIEPISYNFFKKEAELKGHLDEDKKIKAINKAKKKEVKSEELNDFQLIRAIDTVKTLGFINKKPEITKSN